MSTIYHHSSLLNGEDFALELSPSIFGISREKPLKREGADPTPFSLRTRSDPECFPNKHKVWYSSDDFLISDQLSTKYFILPSIFFRSIVSSVEALLCIGDLHIISRLRRQAHAVMSEVWTLHRPDRGSGFPCALDLAAINTLFSAHNYHGSFFCPSPTSKCHKIAHCSKPQNCHQYFFCGQACGLQSLNAR